MVPAVAVRVRGACGSGGHASVRPTPPAPPGSWGHARASAARASPYRRIRRTSCGRDLLDDLASSTSRCRSRPRRTPLPPPAGRRRADRRRSARARGQRRRSGCLGHVRPVGAAALRRAHPPCPVRMHARVRCARGRPPRPHRRIPTNPIRSRRLGRGLLGRVRRGCACGPTTNRWTRRRRPALLVVGVVGSVVARSIRPGGPAPRRPVPLPLWGAIPLRPALPLWRALPDAVPALGRLLFRDPLSRLRTPVFRRALRGAGRRLTRGVGRSLEDRGKPVSRRRLRRSGLGLSIHRYSLRSERGGDPDPARSAAGARSCAMNVPSPVQRHPPPAGLKTCSYNRSFPSGAAPPAWRTFWGRRRRRAPPQLASSPISGGAGRLPARVGHVCMTRITVPGVSRANQGPNHRNMLARCLSASPLP